ncbi:tetratricopeptide repeat protein [Sulfurimonas sp. HSL1-6]|uniref:tetratricopeptide repeat protein n=1 Tax=Thiomicrolovo immobilis TaxID=3131935 RepID=UPI0031F93FA2
MHSRLSHILSTPAVMASLLAQGWRGMSRYRGHRALLPVLLGLFAAVLSLLLLLLWEATLPYRAEQAYREADYNRSAALFVRMEGAAAQYDAGNAWYRSGEYERALQYYSALEKVEGAFGASVWFNRGNTLVRLKEFAKAREAFARSLALRYDEEALANMMHILAAEEQDHMLTGRQEGKKRAQDQAAERSEGGPKKEGGGSNQQSSAERRSGAGSQGKKVEREEQLEFSNKGNSRLSSKQYELINQRNVHETKPW